ncbi:MAG: diaminopimelate epimerase [Clostridia bacterium]|nr:diaminopimelate epimerase [Clostridia bacterium]
MYVEKFCANGNTFILVDSREVVGEFKSKVKVLCDAKIGMGADGVIVVNEGDTPSMTIFNSDGSHANTCGNGLRCVALYLNKRGYPKQLKVKTADKKTPLTVVCDNPFKVVVNLGKPIFLQKDEQVISPTLTRLSVGKSFVNLYKVNMGVPHVVVIDQNAQKYAKQISTHSEFKEGTNVDFVTIKNGKIYASTYERGVGWTDACGTGACAVGAVCFALGLAQNKGIIKFKGGNLTVIQKRGEMFLEGSATRLFGAKIDLF